MGINIIRLVRHINQPLIIKLMLCILIVSCNAPGNLGSEPDLSQPLTADLDTLGESPVTRAEFILELAPKIFGESYQAPKATDNVFTDLKGHWAEDLIEAFAEEGFIAGYPDGTFRPDNPLSRAEAAVVLLRAKYGQNYSPPQPIGGVFTDIDDHWSQAWIEVLAAEGVIDTQSDSKFRPADMITQRDVIVWILRVFGEPQE